MGVKVMAESKLTQKDTPRQASIDWSYEELKPYKLRAIKLFKGLDGLAELFGTRKRLWSKNIIKGGKYRELAKAIHMDYDELKVELERIEREYEEDQRRYGMIKRDHAKHKELREAGRKKEADALMEKMFDNWFFILSWLWALM